MASLVYACRFDITAQDGITSFIPTYRDWIVGHYQGQRELPEFNFDPEVAGAHEGLPTGHSLVFSLTDLQILRAK